MSSWPPGRRRPSGPCPAWSCSWPGPPSTAAVHRGSSPWYRQDRAVTGLAACPLSRGIVFQAGEPALQLGAAHADGAVGELDRPGSLAQLAPPVEGGARDADLGDDLRDGEQRVLGAVAVGRAGGHPWWSLLVCLAVFLCGA